MTSRFTKLREFLQGNAHPGVGLKGLTRGCISKIDLKLHTPTPLERTAVNIIACKFCFCEKTIKLGWKSRMFFLTIHTKRSRALGTLYSSKGKGPGQHLKQLFSTTYSPETGTGRKFSYENKLAQSSLKSLTSLHFISFIVY